MSSYNWISVDIDLPDTLHDKDVIVRIEGSGLYGEYEEYKIIKYRPKFKGFIEWLYNSRGEFNAILYNCDNGQKFAVVTHWRFFEKPDLENN